MKRKAQPRSVPQKAGIVIRPGKEIPLSRAQVEFNRLMKSLETTKARHAREQARLDEALVVASRELMPLVEELNRVTYDIVIMGHGALQSLKLSARRREWFEDLLSGKAEELLADPVGLGAAETERLEAVSKELGPSIEEGQIQESENEEFEFLRAMLEQSARDAGVELDLGGLDPNGDPEEFERQLRERIGAAAALFDDPPADSSTARPRRKPTKAQAERERKRLEQEDAKSRDLKSLFKQLAKAFHPDLEPEPQLKEHKKVWMQRLNTAYAAGDLREMLVLEMEWLGEEATNLATAGDDKLRVYCMVLKEQINDLKIRTHHLTDEPQYAPLHRFIDPMYGTLASPKRVRKELEEALARFREMRGILAKNNASSRKMIYEWADEHALRSSCPF